MSARALQTINSGFGTFNRRDPLRGVPDDIVSAWVDAGIAVYESDIPEPAVRPDLGAMKKADLIALADDAGVSTAGTAEALRARIGDAWAAIDDDPQSIDLGDLGDNVQLGADGDPEQPASLDA